METTTSIDDLFDDDKDEAPKPAAKPKRDKPKARTRPPKPKGASKIAPAADDSPDLIDTAVNIRRLDWECECGNTNTHDLLRCGKCRTHRYQ